MSAKRYVTTRTSRRKSSTWRGERLVLVRWEKIISIGVETRDPTETGDGWYHEPEMGIGIPVGKLDEFIETLRAVAAEKVEP